MPALHRQAPLSGVVERQGPERIGFLARPRELGQVVLIGSRQTA